MLFIIAFPFIIGIVIRIFDIIGVVEIKRSDWNTYLVALVPLIGTSILGAVSFWQTQKANETSKNALTLSTNESQRQVLPYFSFERMRYITSAQYIKSFLSASNDKQENVDYRNLPKPVWVTSQALYITINSIKDGKENDDMLCSCTLTDAQNDLITSYGIRSLDSMKPVEGFMPYTQFLLSNVGRGTAIDIELAFYRVGKDKHGLDEYFSISPGVSVIIGLYFNIMLQKNVVLEYVFSIDYKDIFGEAYNQKCNLKVKRTKEDFVDYYIDKFEHKVVE